MFSKIVNFIKMSWMFFWRLSIFSTLFFRSEYNNQVIWAALLISAVMVFGFNKTFVIFPIFKVLSKRPPLVPADGSGERPVVPHRPRAYPKKKSPTKTDTQTEVIVNVGQLDYVRSATARGRITGFEPKTLDEMPLPHLPNMTGVPGEGLKKATEMDQQRINLGVQGEQNFAKAMHKASLLHRFSTIWSVPVPDQERFIPGPYDTDIDCILATKNSIYLIDLKNYKSGDVRYYAKTPLLLAEDIPTGKQVGEVKRMSRNMEMATNAMRYHFPEAKIVPVVIFMPTNKGEGIIDNVYWPGNVRAVNLAQFMAELSFEEDFTWDTAVYGGAFARMGNLLSMKKQRS